MKRVDSITLDDAKAALRRDADSRLVNCGGFAVLVDGLGQQRYVAADDGCRFIPFANLRGLAPMRLRAKDATQRLTTYR